MPDWTGAIRAHIAANLDGGRESEIIEELSRHMDDRYRELRSSGVSAVDAERLVIEELDGGELSEIRRRAALHAPQIGSPGGRRWLGGFGHDLKVAVRMVRTRPGFAAAVVFMLALGVAGNAAIFSIFNGMFLRPLPFPEAERLVDLDETAPKWNLRYVGISNADYMAWQKGNSAFDAMAFYSAGGANLADSSGAAQRISAARVTHELLPVLGLQPLLGRNFSSEEDRPGGAKVVLLGYSLWQRLYQGDRGVLGRVVKCDGEPFTIIGVLPREAILPQETDVWAPLAADPKRGPGFYLSGIGRVKRGISLDQARADLLRVHKAEIQNGQKVNEITSPVLQPLRERHLGDVRPVVGILLGAVGLVLIIACVNIAGLMLVRGEARSREIAIRTAMGASRGRIIRQLLTESLLLAAAGSLAGVVAGSLLLRGLVSFMPDEMPGWIQFPLDGRFVLFATALAGTAAVLFGLAPALQAAAVDVRGCLQEAGRSTLTRGRRATLSALVVCEIALALVLLAGSGLLVQAFRNVLRVDPGYRPQNVATWSVRLPDAKYPKPAERYAFFADLLERLRAVPGVETVSAASLVPMSGHSGYFFRVESGRTLGTGEKDPVVLRVTALPGYCETMGMSLLGGRSFTPRDEQQDAPPVALINESFAKFFWGSTDVVGKRIRYSWDEKSWMQVVGVLHDNRHYGLDQEVRPSVMVPFKTGPQSGMTVVMRTRLDPHTVVAPAREVLRQVDSELPMFEVRTMTERLDRSLWVRRAYSWLFGVFAVVAITLAATGIYGVISFSVSRRTREIGIRIALGARPRQVMRKVLAGGMVLVGIGVVIGLAVTQLAVRFMRVLLFGVNARDLAVYGAVVAGVALVGLLANYIPARRAASVDPMTTLRAE